MTIPRYTLSGSSATLSPVAPSVADAPGVSLGTVGISSIRARRRSWRIKDVRPFAMLTVDAADDASLMEELGTDVDWARTVGAVTESAVDLQYSGPNGSTVQLKATIDVAKQAVDWCFQAVNLQTPGRALWGMDLVLPVLPLTDAGKDRLSVAFPYLHGSIRHRPCDPWDENGDDHTAYHPTLDTEMDGEPVPGTVIRHPAGVGGIILWDREAETGLLVMALEPALRLKEFRMGGRGDHVHLAVRVFPEDNRVATSWTMPYTIRTVPFRGGLYEGLALYREMARADAGYALPVESFAETADKGGNWLAAEAKRPEFAGDSGYLTYCLLQSDPPGWNEAQSVAEHSEAHSRVVDFLGREPAATMIYGASQTPFGTLEQDQVTDYGVALFNWLQARGVTVGRYTHATWWDPVTAWMQNAIPGDPLGHDSMLGDPTKMVAKLKTGATVTRTVGGGEPGSFRQLPNFGRQEARDLLVDLLDRRFFQDAAADIAWLYLDAFTGVQGAHGDYGLDLAASERGLGSAFFQGGVSQLLEDLRALQTQEGKKPGLTSEWGQEGAGLLLDAVYSHLSPAPFGIPPAFAGRRMPLFGHLWGDYVARIGLETGLGPLPSYILPGVPQAAQFGAQVATSFHAGDLIYLTPTFSDRGYLVWQEGDSQNGPEWEAWGLHAMTVLKGMLDARANFGLAPFFRGRRLATPRGCLEDRIASEPDTPTIVFDGTADLTSSSWAGSAWMELEGRREIAIVLTNYQEADQSLELVVSRDRWPEIPQGRRVIVEDTPSGPVPVATLDQLVRLAITLPAAATKVLRITGG